MITLQLHWWMLPALITVGGIVWAVWIYNDGSSGHFSGLGNIFMLIPVLAISCLSWVIWGVMK